MSSNTLVSTLSAGLESPTLPCTVPSDYRLPIPLAYIFPSTRDITSSDIRPPMPEETILYPRIRQTTPHQDRSRSEHLANKHKRDDTEDEDDGYEAGCESEKVSRKRRRTSSRISRSTSPAGEVQERKYFGLGLGLPSNVAPRLTRRTAFIESAPSTPFIDADESHIQSNPHNHHSESALLIRTTSLESNAEVPGAPRLLSKPFTPDLCIPCSPKSLVGLAISIHIPIRATPQPQSPVQANDPRYDDLIVYLGV
ncbi:hypothetical protein SCP_0504310 [Sparassis crispa]|uniref:Uncharacterized protein n=1 Tax=Sparassis crispa TaxID=139825 RepID=A0A401GMD5_9APHY|nr:hypothetical protein SCP_0504310 [Sparassis crispa]GBE83383.1 hypothetical protein SCP_0504310 [Sparassis crispa]